MKTFAALTLAAALAGGAALMLPVTRAEAAPVGVMAGVLDAGKPVYDQVQYRRRVVRRRGGGRDAALAAGLIGAAVVGGAIIAQSQRDQRRHERAYYYGQQPGYGYYADPYAGGYYAQPVYQQPRRRYVDPGYYHQPGYVQPRYRRNHVVRDPAGGGRLNNPNSGRNDNFYMP